MSLVDFITKQIQNLGIGDKVEGLQDFLVEQGSIIARGSEVALKELSSARSACQMELKAIQDALVRDVTAVIRTIRRQLMILRMEIGLPKNDVMKFLGLA